MDDTGKFCYKIIQDLFELNRSLTGNGVRQTLSYIKNIIPQLEIKEVSSGTKAFDWTIPDEWNVREAYIIDPNGNKIANFAENNLHLVGYSRPINCEISLSELQMHLHSLVELPDAIPYVTSYYSSNWGFCISQNQRDGLADGVYKVIIDSELKKGSMTYGEILIPGETDKEIFLSTYICHPSMANNELSGPSVTVALLKWLLSIRSKHTIRAVFIPETIGSIYYISKHLRHLQKTMKAGFVITCTGDNLSYSFLPTKFGNKLIDRAAIQALNELKLDYVSYDWSERGSDERQYSSPGVDLPVVSLMRTKYGKYDEYHTSLDNLEFISTEGLDGAYRLIKKVISLVDSFVTPCCNFLCEPRLSKYDLYPVTTHKGGSSGSRNILNVLSYCDGKTEIEEIARLTGLEKQDVSTIVEQMMHLNLLQ